MTYQEEQGFDSYIATLVNNKKDTFYMEYGGPRIIYDISTQVPPVWSNDSKEMVTKRAGKPIPSDELLFSDDPKEDMREDIFDINFYQYDTINSIVVKIVQPKKCGEGITGIYIPKLKDSNSFSMYAKNLDSVWQKEALKIYRSIKYK
jgi:hypothetical protein